jgi:hypothetical protein
MCLSVSLACLVATLTGRLGEAEEASRRLSSKRKEIIQLRKLTEMNPRFMLALKEQEEALLYLRLLKLTLLRLRARKNWFP